MLQAQIPVSSLDRPDDARAVPIVPTLLPTPSLPSLSAITQPGEPAASGAPFASRSGRVMALTLGVLAMSIADLWLTLTHLQTVGMFESNPLARWVMQLNCGWALGVWKLALVGMTCSILHFTRQRRATELAAWVCFAIMAWLMFQWIGYADQVALLTPSLANLNQGSGETWVRLGH